MLMIFALFALVWSQCQEEVGGHCENQTIKCNQTCKGECFSESYHKCSSKEKCVYKFTDDLCHGYSECGDNSDTVYCNERDINCTNFRYLCPFHNISNQLETLNRTFHFITQNDVI